MNELGVWFDQPQREYMSQFDLEAVQILFNLVFRQDHAAIIGMVTPPAPAISFTPSGD